MKVYAEVYNEVQVQLIVARSGWCYLKAVSFVENFDNKDVRMTWGWATFCCAVGPRKFQLAESVTK